MLLIAVVFSFVVRSAIPSESTTNPDTQTVDPDHRGTFLTGPLDRLEALIPERDCLTPNVSQVDVAWHLDHSLKVINGIYGQLEASNPEEYRRSFKLARFFVFATGKLPRGKAKAPQSVVPPDSISTEDLHRQLKTARARMQTVDRLPEKSHFKHAVFGRLRRNQAKRVIEIHTEHHLAIIDDIVQGCRADGHD